MTTLWFIVPANGREDLARVCLRQLRRTCDLLEGYGIRASAVVIADDENLDTAAELGFGTVERENKPLGRKFNDGFELAGIAGVDYVMPLGSDDWVDHEWVAGMLPDDDTIRCSRNIALISPDRRSASLLEVPYIGGHGIRMIPRALLERTDFRPAEEDKPRAIDASVMRGIGRTLGRHPNVVYYESHVFQVVDWKSSSEQLNTYEMCERYRKGSEVRDPFAWLRGVYPESSITEMRELEAVAA